VKSVVRRRCAGRLGLGAASAFVGLIPLLAASGCSMLPSNSPAASRQEEMQRRILELERKAVVAETEIDRLRQKVASLEAGGVPGAAVTPRSAPQQPARAVAEPRIAPAPPIRAEELPEPVETIASSPAGPANVAPPLPAGALEPASADARSAYDRAFALFHQGNYDEAERAFRNYLEAYSANDLSDNAVYWIGECRLARSDWNGALRSFQEVVERFPAGNKVADALFKAGQALERLGDLDNARESYRVVIERFPDSGAAALARERLAAGG
jgi:tol-pal system protein YbgF